MSTKAKAWLAAVVLAVVGALLLPIVMPLMVVMALMSSFGGGGGAPSSVAGMSNVLLNAYTLAAVTSAKTCPGMRWSVLAAVGQVESSSLAGRTISNSGKVSPPVFGPVLDGSGAGGNTTPVWDTDSGRLDFDTRYDRAVGPLQFLPATWAAYGADGNGDGRKDPQNVYDIALAAANYLCQSAGGDLTDPARLRTAILAYNRSETYLADVLTWIDTFDALSSAALPAATTDRGRRIVNAAMSRLGTPYSWGGGGLFGPSFGIDHGASILGFDCSGLTVYAYAKAGIRLPRVSADQWAAARATFTSGPAAAPQRIPASAGIAAVRPGDLVFFASAGTVDHVGIYIGGGKMVNAPRTGTVVRVEPLWLDTYVGAVHYP